MPSSASLQDAELSLSVLELTTETEVLNVISHLTNLRSSGWDEFDLRSAKKMLPVYHQYLSAHN